MAPRASWKGYLKISLVSCPVRLFSATTSADKIAFNQLHKDTHNRIQMKPVDPELGQVERSDLVKGYEFEKDQYVVITDEDLEAIQIESTKTINIETFIDADEIDAMYLDASYYLAPDGPVADETYRVLQEAMRAQNKAALGRVVLFGRERLVVLMPRENGLMLRSLRAAKEVRSHEEYFADIGDGKVEKDALKLAEHLIEQNAGTFDPSVFEDRYQTALMELVKAKIKGSAPVIAKAPERGQVINLMDALKKSLAETKKPPAKSKRRAPAIKAARRKKAS